MTSVDLIVTTIYEYDKDYNFIKYSSASAILSSNCKYVKLKGRHTINGTTITQSMLDNAKLQLEEGTVATTFESYKEDKLTIL